MAIKGIVVNGVTYAISFSDLDGLPSFLSVSRMDAGKVLLVDQNGNWVASQAPDGLPSVSQSDAGKGLQVNSSGQWEVTELDAGSGLPAVSQSDEGKILMVDSNGNWVTTMLTLQENDGVWTTTNVPYAEEASF